MRGICKKNHSISGSILGSPHFAKVTCHVSLKKGRPQTRPVELAYIGFHVSSWEVRVRGFV